MVFTYDHFVTLLDKGDNVKNVYTEHNGFEVFWTDHHEWLSSIGYLLRPRFRPGWVPSWIGTDKYARDCEDGQVFAGVVMDATRVADGKPVSLKMIWKCTHPNEVAIAQYLSSPELASDPKNHCVPIFEVLDVPDYEGLQILVMPLLRTCNEPAMRTVGEAVGFFQQIFEGLQFLHKHNVAHRDCADRNVMMYCPDMFPKGYHPAEPSRTVDLKKPTPYRTRTECSPRYYIIDFGISRRFTDDSIPRLLPAVLGVDKSVPEFQEEGMFKKWNPFPIDIYYIGNIVREDFLWPYRNFDFMVDLVNDMVNSDPSKRPTIDEVVTRFESISQSLSGWKLRSRLCRRSEFTPFSACRDSAHLFTRLKHIIKRYPAIPSSTLPRPAHIPFEAVTHGFTQTQKKSLKFVDRVIGGARAFILI